MNLMNEGVLPPNELGDRDEQREELEAQDTELKPCPCCGAEAELTSWSYKNLLTARVSCTNCLMNAYADSDRYYEATLDELEGIVIEAWNNRKENAND